MNTITKTRLRRVLFYGSILFFTLAILDLLEIYDSRSILEGMGAFGGSLKWILLFPFMLATLAMALLILSGKSILRWIVGYLVLVGVGVWMIAKVIIAGMQDYPAAKSPEFERRRLGRMR